MNEIYKGYTIKIQHDELCESPREWDNLGTMICKHRRYDLGDSAASKDFPWYEFSSWQEARNYLLKNMDAAVVLPLYLYDHSGITMNTTGFACRWDSGQVGFIYATKEKIRAEYGWKRLTKKRLQQIQDILDGEVKTYDQYLTGDVYGYTIEKNGEHIDSCWGYYGQEDCLNEAKSIIDHYEKKEVAA
jgi:hypothetical protein